MIKGLINRIRDMRASSKTIEARAHMYFNFPKSLIPSKTEITYKAHPVKHTTKARIQKLLKKFPEMHLDEDRQNAVLKTEKELSQKVLHRVREILKEKE